MIEINLLFEEMRKKETVKITMPEIPIKKTLFVSIGAVLALQTLFTLFALYLRLEDSMLKNEIARLQASGKEVFQQKSETTAMQTRLRDIRSTTVRAFHWASLLSELSNSMTKGVWLRVLYVTDEEPKSKGASEKGPAADKKRKKEEDKKEEGGTTEKYLVLEGSAVGQGQETAFIGKFLKQLKDNPLFTELFSEIKPYNINQRRFNDFDVYDFMMYCKFKKDKQ